jgi:hypothetical protein
MAPGATSMHPQRLRLIGMLLKTDYLSAYEF